MKLNAKVQFCGKERKFQRCPNKTLRDYKKSMEDIREEMIPLAEHERDSQFKLDELSDEIDSINKHIELLERLDDPSDVEIRECIDLTKKKISLQKEIHQVRIDFSEKVKSDKDLYESLDKKLNETYCDFAKLVFKDFTDDDFDEADETDLLIAPRLDELYRLATSGAKQKDVDKLYQKIIKSSFQ